MAGEWSKRLAHYRSMFDNAYIGAWDIPTGRDAVVTIKKITGGTLKSQRGTDRKPIAFFEGKKKGMVLNKTNCKTIAAMYGDDTDAWIGKQIAIYASTTTAGGETVACLRVRSGEPRSGGQQTSMVPDPPEDDREPGSDG